ncbi:MAG: hypothetical protein P8Z36_11305 [Gemmatimonadota bacterium]
MHAAVREHDERLLARLVQVARNEDVGVEPDRVAGTLGRRVGLVPRRRPGEGHQVDIRDVAQAVEEHDIVYLAAEHVDLVLETFHVPLKQLPDLSELHVGLGLCSVRDCRCSDAQQGGQQDRQNRSRAGHGRLLMLCWHSQ